MRETKRRSKKEDGEEKKDNQKEEMKVEGIYPLGSHKA